VDVLSGFVDSEFQVDDNLVVNLFVHLDDDFQMCDNLVQVSFGVMDFDKVVDHDVTVFDDS